MAPPTIPGAPDSRSRLRQQFDNQPVSDHGRRWDELWKQDFTPWDRNGPSVALRDTIIERSNQLLGSLDAQISRRKRALVPGCGRGYDVLLLASLGYDAFGLDISESAVAAARKLQADSDQDGLFVVDDEKIGRGKVEFANVDFFNGDIATATNGEKFDLIFDYTFLCAIPSELRPSWAKRMHELLEPTGRLICLEWPLGKDPHEGGPPHGLTSSLYVELLGQPGQKVEYDERGIVVSSHGAASKSQGLKRVEHFMPSSTHEAGKDKDYISIWAYA